MAPRKSTRKLDATKRGELEIAAAVAREAVMQLHMGAAMRMIELAADRVSAMRILNIYLRVHGFNEADATILSNRVLAQIGQRAARGTTPAPSLVSDDEAVVEADSVSLLRAVRERLRGRIHHDLRRWVELHTGATQMALLQVHIRQAERFVSDLAATHSIDTAVAVYVELVGVPVALRSILYYGVLERLAEVELPKRKAPGSRGEAVTILPKDAIA